MTIIEELATRIVATRCAELVSPALNEVKQPDTAKWAKVVKASGAKLDHKSG